MSPLPPAMLARWLPDWRAFAEAALEAAQAPAAEPAALMALAERAQDWPSPFEARRDQYVGAMLIWAAKAFCRQDSAAMRATLDGALLECALAFKARLARAEIRLQRNDGVDAVALTVVASRRLRRDIDDVDDEAGG